MLSQQSLFPSKPPFLAEQAHLTANGVDTDIESPSLTTTIVVEGYIGTFLRIPATTTSFVFHGAANIINADSLYLTAKYADATTCFVEIQIDTVVSASLLHLTMFVTPFERRPLQKS